MVFTPDEAVEIKKQLLEQVEKLDNPNKEQIKKYVEGLDETGLESFLKQNNIKIGEEGLEQEDDKSSPDKSGPKEQKCVFCQITKNELPSYKIAENKKSIAVLEINPLSKAHSIVIPIEHGSVEKIPKSALSLSQKIAKKIKKKFKPEDIKIETASFMGHSMINIIPLYKDVQLKKTKAEEDELKKLQRKLEVKKRRPRKIQKLEEKTEEQKMIEIKKLPKFPPFRIPR
ncbi:MAG: HIT domain-containing protein [Nanoarchaeota archaeon]|nr:HIT domain-containing protein [Nanoarchaeota archaeon]